MELSTCSIYAKAHKTDHVHSSAMIFHSAGLKAEMWAIVELEPSLVQYTESSAETTAYLIGLPLYLFYSHRPDEARNLRISR